jgi:uncharacterized membrane protein (DUF485 family)
MKVSPPISPGNCIDAALFPTTLPANIDTDIFVNFGTNGASVENIGVCKADLLDSKQENQMLHEPAEIVTEKDHAISYKTRLGVWMFIFYALVYVGFILINIIRPELMEKQIILGLNLAVVYGFGLIILSIIMALIYNALCVRKEKALNGKELQREAN